MNPRLTIACVIIQANRAIVRYFASLSGRRSAGGRRVGCRLVDIVATPLRTPFVLGVVCLAGFCNTEITFAQNECWQGMAHLDCQPPAPPPCYVYDCVPVGGWWKCELVPACSSYNCHFRYCVIDETRSGGYYCDSNDTCNDNNPCTHDWCDVAFIWHNDPVDQPDIWDPAPRCNDNDPCTEDRCRPGAGECEFVRLDCSNANPCDGDE